MAYNSAHTGAHIDDVVSNALLHSELEQILTAQQSPAFRDVEFTILAQNWTEDDGEWTAEVSNSFITATSGTNVTYDSSFRTALTGDITAEKQLGKVVFTTNGEPRGNLSGNIRIISNITGTTQVSTGGTGAGTPRAARANLNVPIRDIPIDFGTVSSLPQTVQDADLTADMRACDITYGNPSALSKGIDVTFAVGSVTISLPDGGTLTGSTTIKFWAHEVRSAVEGGEPVGVTQRAVDFVQINPQSLTPGQQAQVLDNIGAADICISIGTPISIPAAGESVSYNLPGMTEDHQLVRWNYSSSPENSPPCALSWATYDGYFTIGNTSGTTSETILPMFLKPTIRTATLREEEEES